MNDNTETLALTFVRDGTDLEWDERATRGEVAEKFLEKGIRDEVKWQKQQKQKRTHTRSGRPNMNELTLTHAEALALHEYMMALMQYGSQPLELDEIHKLALRKLLNVIYLK